MRRGSQICEMRTKQKVEESFRQSGLHSQESFKCPLQAAWNNNNRISPVVLPFLSHTSFLLKNMTVFRYSAYIRKKLICKLSLKLLLWVATDVGQFIALQESERIPAVRPCYFRFRLCHPNLLLSAFWFLALFQIYFDQFRKVSKIPNLSPETDFVLASKCENNQFVKFEHF